MKGETRKKRNRIRANLSYGAKLITKRGTKKKKRKEKKGRKGKTQYEKRVHIILHISLTFTRTQFSITQFFSKKATELYGVNGKAIWKE